MHLDEEQVQRLLHRELAPRAEAAARDHVDACADCRWQVEEAQREEARVLELLRHVDHPPPRVAAAATMARARAGRGTRGRWVRRAAGIVVATAAAGAAYAATGSPLPRVIDRVVAWVHRQPAPPVPPAPAARPSAPEAAAGISVTPGGRFTIVFPANRVGGVATVTLTEGTDVTVRARAGRARFTSDVDGILVESLGDSVRFEIEVPRRAASVEMRVGSRRVFVKDGVRVSAEGRRDAEGKYHFRLPRPGP